MHPEKMSINQLQIYGRITYNSWSSGGKQWAAETLESNQCKGLTLKEKHREESKCLRNRKEREASQKDERGR